jgi:hypothetical protein
MRERARGTVFRLAFFVCGASLAMGLAAFLVEDDGAVAAFGALVGAAMCAAVYALESSISPVLAKATVYIFLVGALQPTTPVLYYWSKETPENCSGDYGERPCFSPEFVGAMSTVGYVFFLLGTAAYNRFASHWPYRTIFLHTQLALVAVNLIDLVWVTRINLALGISDKWFMVGEEVLGPMVGRFNTMPLFVLASKLCPDGVEATLFAMTMGISNFGATMGGYTGIGLLGLLGGVEAPQFAGMTELVVVRSLTRLLPIALIPFLVPLGSPADEGMLISPRAVRLFARQEASGGSGARLAPGGEPGARHGRPASSGSEDEGEDARLATGRGSGVVLEMGPTGR